MASTSTWQRSGGPHGSPRPLAPDAWRAVAAGEPDDWVADEPRIFDLMIRELQRFKRRMKVHPLPVLALALVMTAGAVFMFARKPQMHTARVILRIGEGALSDYRGSVLPRSELKDYVYSFALPDSVLLERIIEKHDIFRDELELFGPDGAIAELRDGLSIEVFHNFFHFSKTFESTPRSLRVGIVYMHRDAELAYKLAVLLSDLVVEVESKKRLQEVRFAASNAREVLAAVEGAYERREHDISAAMTTLTEAELADEGVTAAMARVEIASLARLQLMERQVVESVRRETQQLERALELEERNMGMVFELAGRVRPVPEPPPGPFLLCLVGLVCFCIFVPVCAIGLGTSDSRIHELDDVSRLGLPVLGHIPAFEGDGVASLRRRGALEPPGLRGRLGLGHRRVRRAPQKIV